MWRSIIIVLRVGLVELNSNNQIKQPPKNFVQYISRVGERVLLDSTCGHVHVLIRNAAPLCSPPVAIGFDPVNMYKDEFLPGAQRRSLLFTRVFGVSVRVLLFMLFVLFDLAAGG